MAQEMQCATAWRALVMGPLRKIVFAKKCGLYSTYERVDLAKLDFSE